MTQKSDAMLRMAWARATFSRQSVVPDLSERVAQDGDGDGDDDAAVDPRRVDAEQDAQHGHLGDRGGTQVRQAARKQELRVGCVGGA
jgi:hypothetical protein